MVKQMGPTNEKMNIRQEQIEERIGPATYVVQQRTANNFADILTR